MPKPPLAACGHDVLYICAVCGECGDHCCSCSPPGTLVSISSVKAAEAIRRARLAKELAPKGKG
jgi:hypothetical protein